MLVFVGTVVVPLRSTQFAAVNTVIVVAWVILAWRVGYHYRARTGTLTSEGATAKVEAPGVA